MLDEITHLFDQHGVISANRLPNVMLTLDDVPAVLEEIQSFFSAGGIVPLEGSRTFAQWHVQKYDQVESILAIMLPNLRRQEHQARYALELTKLIRREFGQPHSEKDRLIRRMLADSILLTNDGTA